MRQIRVPGARITPIAVQPSRSRAQNNGGSDLDIGSAGGYRRVQLTDPVALRNGQRLERSALLKPRVPSLGAQVNLMLDPVRPFVDFDAIAAARERIAPFVRRTPVMEADRLREPPADMRLFLKLEHLQASGSFKARGATNKLLTTPNEALARGVVTASGGNHGLATARAAWNAGVAATVFVPETISAEKAVKLERWGAMVRRVGHVWDESNVAALAFAETTGAAYFHPFGDPAVVAGQGTLGLEVAEQLPDIDVLLVSIGGGGLVAGLCVALKTLKPGLRIIGVEPTGSPTLKASLDAGQVTRLGAVTTRVATMGCGQTVDAVFSLVRQHIDGLVLVEDDAMVEAARWLWFELGIAADLSGAAGMAALKAGLVETPPGSRVCTIICGAGSEGM